MEALSKATASKELERGMLMEKTLRELMLPKHLTTSYSTQYLPHNAADEPRGAKPA